MKPKLGDVIAKGTFEYNPVLIQCVGLCPVILASTSVQSALAMTAVTFADLLITSILASTVMKKWQRYIRVVFYLIIGMLIIFPILWFIENKTIMNMTLGMRIFLPLIAVNSVTAVHCEQFAVKNGLRPAVFDAIAAGLGTGIVMLLCGTLREIGGKGTFLGYPLGVSFKLSGMLMPYGCLVILGFAAAVLNKTYTRKPRRAKKEPVSSGPEEVSLDIDSGKDPEQIDMDFTFDDDEEYEYLLSSVNELIESFSMDSEREDEQ